MLYWLSDFQDTFQFFNLFRYITWRTGGAMMTAAVFMFIAGSPIIDWLRAAQGKGQPIRADGPQSHLKSKIGTPTMGGLMIIFAVTVSTILWANPANPYVWIVLGVTLAFGVIGFYDDYLKVTKQQAYTSFSGKLRITAETIVALAACYAISQLGRPGLSTSIAFPFFKDLLLPLGWVWPRSLAISGVTPVPPPPWVSSVVAPVWFSSAGPVWAPLRTLEPLLLVCPA